MGFSTFYKVKVSKYLGIVNIKRDNYYFHIAYAA